MRISERICNFARERTNKANKYGTGKWAECCTEGIPSVAGTHQNQEELEELSQVVSDYYARKAEEEMNRLWETGQWSKEKDEEIMRTHLRTPYKYAK